MAAVDAPDRLIPRDTFERSEPFSEGTNPEFFPALTDKQVQAIAALAECREYEPGEALFRQGLRDAPFYFVERGSVDFIDRGARGVNYFAMLHAGGFIGDISIFTGEPTVAECRAAEPTR
ncbi:MAG: cyclic nucleotide-binding domain-containing protein, partial [Planctomycetota bacterium]